MLRKILILIGGFIILSSFVNAQVCVSTSPYSWEWPSHNNWFFGNGQIGTFSGGFSITNKGASFTSYEGTITASDDQGNLLFFSNGIKLWDAAGNQKYADLLAGKGGGVNSSAVVGDMVVKHPLEPDIFYIFTGDDAIDAANGLKYFEVDAGGNVLSGPTYLSNNSTTEGLAAIKHSNGVDIWVMSQKAGTNDFYAYLITCDGVQTSAVISSNAPNWSGDAERGGMAFSSDGSKFAIGHNEGSWADAANALIVYEFDNSTGLLSNKTPVAADAGPWGPINVRDKDVYDVCFSPDGSKIYYSTNGGKIGHYDLSTWTQTAINGSWQEDATGGGGHGALEIGADGALYHSPSSSIRRLTGNLNAGTGLSYSGSLGSSNLGLPTMYLPPEEEPDIEEVGPYCSTDEAIDLNTLWLCSGINAEDPTNHPTAYTGIGITDQANGIFDPSLAGVGVHEIIFTFCNVDDTIWITVNDCATCESELDNVEPEICVGETVTLDDFVLNASADGVWTIDSMPVGTSPVITTGTDTIFDASNLAVTAGTYKLLYTVTDGAEICYDSIYIIVNPLPIVDLGDDQEICADGSTVTFDAGTHTSYLWNDGSTDQTLETSTAGEYWVKVTNVNGCSDTDTVNLTVNTLPVVDLGPDQEICDGESVTFDAGSFDSYLWNDASSNQTLDATVAGDYWVKITDANGCTDSDSVVLVVNALPVVDLGPDQEVCDGVTVTFDAGSFDSYLWNDASVNQTLDATVSGDYVVKVTDANGCTDSDSVVLVVNALPVVDLGPDQEICDGESVTFDAGSFDSYLWNDASSNQTLDATVAGDYWVKITDANGCTDSDSVVLVVNALPVVDLGPDQEICDGVTVTFDAGSFDSYLWNDASVNQTLDATVSGDYVVKVTDANGCTDSDSVVLVVNALPVVDLGPDQEVCDGVTVTFDAGSFDSYLWNDASVNQTLDATVSGDYVVKVTDANGCTDSDSVVLVVNALPVVDLGPDQEICDGESVTFDAGSFDSYLWNDASTNQTLDVTAAGDYWVKITDANGCTDSDSVVLVVNALPVVDLGPDQEFCEGGSVTFDAGVFDSYLWNDATTNQTLDASASGDYVVKVSDANGCTDSDSVVVIVNALPVVDLGPDVDICAGGLGIMFDAGDFDAYAWLPTGEVTQTINTNTAGEYIVEVTDSKGCVDTDSVVLVVNENPIVDLGNDITICPGSAVTLDAGPNFANYVWSDASMNQTLEVTDANAGVFNVLAIDTNNCSARDTIEVIVAAELSVDLGPDTAFCEGNSITLDAGNIAGATYEWKPNLEDTQTIEVSTTAEYSVLVVDPMGCQGKDTIVVTVNPNPVVDLGPDVTVCPDVDSLFTVGAGWSEITWNDGSSNESIVLNSEGTYYVDVVDANGCTATDTAEFAFFAGASVDLGKDLTICPGTFANFDAGSFASYTWHDGSNLQTYEGTTAEKIWVDVVDANGCEAVDTAEIFMASSLPVDLGPDTAICEGESVTIESGYPTLGYTFTWKPTNEGTNEITVSTAGKYDVLVEDAAGCKGRDTIEIVVNALPIVDLGPDKAVCEGFNELFDAGTGWTNIEWNTAETTQDITVDSAGLYIVEVTDANGCLDTDTAELVVNPNPTPNLGNDQTVCPGSAALFDAGAYATYEWQDLSTESTYGSQVEEKVWVTVTDVNGCVGSDTADIFVREALLVDLGPDLDTCAGNTIDIVSGYLSDAGYSFVWNTAEVTEQITVDATGKYYVDVVDANGCAGNDTINITVHENPVVELGPNQSVCEGDSVIFDAGIGWTTIEWNDASTNQTLTVKTTATYSVTVTDANGCIGLDDVDLTINANPTVSIGPDVEVCPGNEVIFSTVPNGFASYTWHDGSSNSTFATINPQEVSVEVTDANGCTAVDTANLTNLPALDVQLPANQKLCEGEEYEIVVPGFDPADHTFKWNDNSSNPTLVVNQTGTYSVFVSNGGGCAGFDTIRVEVNPNPTPIVGDTAVCEGETAQMATQSFASYSWNTRENTREIDVVEAGDYTVTVTDLNGCSGSATGTFTINANPVIPAYEDQTACEGEEITLSPNLPVGTYLWKPTGDNTSTLAVASNGDYEIVLTDVNGCKDSISIKATFNALPSLDLGEDVVICEGETANIGFESGGSTLVWDQGSIVADYLNVQIDGEYVATLTDGNGCSDKDTVEVRVSENPTPKASNDTVVCMQEIRYLALNVETNSRNEVYWSNGVTTTENVIDVEGTYTVTATNSDGCVGKDTVLVERKCISSLFVPNSFTPNLDGINDHFGPKGLNIIDFDFYVFNRWGEQIFHSTNMDNKWDGTYMGRECQIDVYVWKVYYKTEEEYGGFKRQQQVGTVTLYR